MRCFHGLMVYRDETGIRSGKGFLASDTCFGCKHGTLWHGCANQKDARQFSCSVSWMALQVITILSLGELCTSLPHYEFVCNNFHFSSGILFQATILLVLKCGYCYVVCCNPILCVWWMLKFLLLVPHLQRDFTSLQVQLIILRKFCMAFSAPSFLK